MGGMEMMFKNLLGVDPSEIKEQFEKGMKTLGDTLKHFDARLIALETQQAETNRLLSALLVVQKPITEDEHGEETGDGNGNRNNGNGTVVE